MSSSEVANPQIFQSRKIRIPDVKDFTQSLQFRKLTLHILHILHLPPPLVSTE